MGTSARSGKSPNPWGPEVCPGQLEQQDNHIKRRASANIKNGIGTLKMEKRFLTARETAFYLGLSEDTIRKWAIRGKIPFFKFGKALRFDIEKINRWANQKACYYV